MTSLKRLSATLLLIRHTISPAKGRTVEGSLLAAGSGTSIPPERFAAALRMIGSNLGPDGTLELFFTGALAPAAPFLLYHLKRNGFSDCRAVVSGEGIKLTARR